MQGGSCAEHQQRDDEEDPGLFSHGCAASEKMFASAEDMMKDVAEVRDGKIKHSELLEDQGIKHSPMLQCVLYLE